MINALVIALLVTIFTIEYVVRDLGWLHPYFVLVPELLSTIAMIIVLSRLMAGVRIALDLRYVLVLALLAFTMVFGFIVQDVPTGAIVAGIRAHLKFIPFFLLPAVYQFTPAQLRTQLGVFMALLLLQAPLAVYQRFVQFADRMETGDPVKGTATASSALSMLLVCGIAVVVALYLRRRIKLPVLIAALGLLFLPTTINETKATLLLLPVALLLPALCMPRGSKTIRKLLPVATLGAVAGFAFIAAYDYLIQYRTYGQPIGEFLTTGDSIERYLYTRGSEEDLSHIGRFDSIEIAVERLGEEPLRLAFGLGAGNVSPSFLPLFDGQYAPYFERYGVDMTQVTNLLWQVGVVGLALYLALYYFVFRDAQLLSRGNEPLAILGQIWITVVVIMTFALLYKSVFSMTEIGYPFWFYSGVVAGYAVRQRRASQAQRSARRRVALRRAAGAVPARPNLHVVP